MQVFFCMVDKKILPGEGQEREARRGCGNSRVGRQNARPADGVPGAGAAAIAGQQVKTTPARAAGESGAGQGSVLSQASGRAGAHSASFSKSSFSRKSGFSPQWRAAMISTTSRRTCGFRSVSRNRAGSDFSNPENGANRHKKRRTPCCPFPGSCRGFGTRFVRGPSRSAKDRLFPRPSV